MNSFFQKLLKLFFLQVRFAVSGLVATSVDYGLYLLLVHRVLAPVPANVVSYSIAVVVNYILQRRFVFQLQRPGYQAFLLSILVSMGGLGISSGIIFLLSNQPFFNERQYITKLLATGIVFFYNFFLKRFVFEKKMFNVD
ncbi:MAG: GtrA family protein [Haliscomenobacter sp.]|nr:GtrA family protein [Haliscomenobacter sp.]MBK7478103.1 GtrA family protein [Haliscomenobacter sp.]MBK8877812.1 GtrA family protein [Haliscomenobacter sp.]